MSYKCEKVLRAFLTNDVTEVKKLKEPVEASIVILFVLVVIIATQFLRNSYGSMTGFYRAYRTEKRLKNLYSFVGIRQN